MSKKPTLPQRFLAGLPLRILPEPQVVLVLLTLFLRFQRAMQRILRIVELALIPGCL